MNWFTPHRFLMVFTQRGGSTFLAHCLDSHPDIGAERGEPLHEQHIWHGTLQDVPPSALLRLILDRPGYKATVARVTYRHYKLIDTAYLKRLDGIIHLHRENVVRITFSSWMNRRGLRETHTYERLPQIQTPTLIIHGDRDLLMPVENAEVLRRIRGSRVQIVPGVGHLFFWEKPHEAAQAIMQFLLPSIPAPA